MKSCKIFTISDRATSDPIPNPESSSFYSRLQLTGKASTTKEYSVKRRKFLFQF